MIFLTCRLLADVKLYENASVISISSTIIQNLA